MEAPALSGDGVWVVAGTVSLSALRSEVWALTSGAPAPSEV